MNPILEPVAQRTTGGARISLDPDKHIASVPRTDYGRHLASLSMRFVTFARLAGLIDGKQGRLALEDTDRQQLFDRVLEKHKRGLIAVARGYAQGDESQELYRAILLEIWSCLHVFESTSRLGTFVFRVALNTATTYRSSAWCHARSPSNQSDKPEITVRPGLSGAVSILEAFVHSLGEVDRSVFLLFLEDMSCQEVSEVTGLAEARIRVKIRRLKNSLKAQAVEDGHRFQETRKCSAET